MAKVRRLNSLVDDSRTVRAYEDYIKDREVLFNEVKRVKKQYIKKMELLKKAALKSEDFKVVYIATNELRDTRDRLRERLYRTWKEHVLYHIFRAIKLTFQYTVALFWATVMYIPFIFLFCFGFVCSDDIDVNDGEWHGEDMEASVAAAAFPLMVVLGYPGYVMDMRGYLFGREGERKNWIWRKVFRPRNFDEDVMKRLYKISDDLAAEKDKSSLDRDMEKSLEQLQEEAKGGVKEFAARVLDKKEARNDKARKVNLGDD